MSTPLDASGVALNRSSDVSNGFRSLAEEFQSFLIFRTARSSSNPIDSSIAR